MRHLAVERWSRGDGPLHRRDPRAKTLALLAFLIAVAVTDRRLAAAGAAWLAGLAATAFWARLPVAGLLARAAIVLPFSGTYLETSNEVASREVSLIADVRAYERYELRVNSYYDQQEFNLRAELFPAGP